MVEPFLNTLVLQFLQMIIERDHFANEVLKTTQQHLVIQLVSAVVYHNLFTKKADEISSAFTIYSIYIFNYPVLFLFR